MEIRILQQVKFMFCKIFSSTVTTGCFLYGKPQLRRLVSKFGGCHNQLGRKLKRRNYDYKRIETRPWIFHTSRAVRKLFLFLRSSPRIRIMLLIFLSFLRYAKWMRNNYLILLAFVYRKRIDDLRIMRYSVNWELKPNVYRLSHQNCPYKSCVLVGKMFADWRHHDETSASPHVYYRFN